MFILVGHIKRVDGLSGCFRGLGPRLVGTIVSSCASDKIANKLGYIELPEDEKDEDLTEEQ